MMAALIDSSNHLESLKEMVSCSVCEEVLTDPCCLPCFHCLCSTCKGELDTEEQDGEAGIRCPICNVFAKDSERENNSLMKQLVEVFNKVSEGRYECMQCKNMSGTWRCIDCKVDLCDHCQQGHQNITVCKGHRTVRHDECDPSILPKIDTFVYCKKHPTKEIEFYCTQCERVMCYKCYVLSCSQHVCESLEAATDRLTPQVDADTNTLRERSKNYREQVEKFRTQADVITQTAEDVKAAILSEKEELMARIEEEYKVKINNLEATTQERLRHVNANRETLEYSAASLESLSNWSKNVVNNTAGASQLVELQNSLIPNLKKVCDSPVTNPTLDTDVTAFAPTRLVDTHENLLGRVATSSN